MTTLHHLGGGQCKTSGGNGGGAACVFPFKSGKVMYSHCTKKGHNRPWCATTRKANKHYKRWGNCLKGCHSTGNAKPFHKNLYHHGK